MAFAASLWGWCSKFIELITAAQIIETHQDLRIEMKKHLLQFLTVIPLIGILSQDYDLEECVRAALMNKETIKSSSLDVDYAKLGQKGSWSAILPSVNFSGSVNETNAAATSFSTDWRSSVNISQTIYDGGAWWNTISGGRNDVEIAIHLERQIRIQVILSVVEAYFQLLKSQELLEVHEKGIEASNQNLQIVEKKYDLGAVSKTDLLKAKKNKGQSTVQVLTQKTQVASALRNLRNAMGLLNTTTEVTVKRSKKPLSFLPDLEEALKIMETQNPELLRSQAQIRKSELDWKLTRSLRLPAVTANLNYGTSVDDPSNFVSGYTEDWNMTGSVSLSIPIFSGMNLSTREQQSKLILTRKQLDHITTENEKTLLLKSTLDALMVAQETISIYNDILTSAEEDLKLAQERYLLGAATILEVLDAQVAETKARSDMITTQYNARIDEAYLKATMGILDREFD